MPQAGKESRCADLDLLRRQRTARSLPNRGNGPKAGIAQNLATETRQPDGENGPDASEGNHHAMPLPPGWADRRGWPPGSAHAYQCCLFKIASRSERNASVSSGDSNVYDRACQSSVRATFVPRFFNAQIAQCRSR